MDNPILCSMYHSSIVTYRVPWLNIYDSYTYVQTALKLTEEEHFEWVQIDSTVKGGIMLQPIYAVSLVGFGRTSKAFCVITKDGYEDGYMRKTDDRIKSILMKAEFVKIALKAVNSEQRACHISQYHLSINACFQTRACWSLRPLDALLHPFDLLKQIFETLIEIKRTHIQIDIIMMKMFPGGTLGTMGMEFWHSNLMILRDSRSRIFILLAHNYWHHRRKSLLHASSKFTSLLQVHQ